MNISHLDFMTKNNAIEEIQRKAELYNKLKSINEQIEGHKSQHYDNLRHLKQFLEHYIEVANK